MAGRKIEDEADARACIAAQRRSGLELSAWSRQHGIDGRSLHCWRMSLARRKDTIPLPAPEPPSSPPRLVELVVTPAPKPLSARYVIRCGTFSIEVTDDFDQDTLFRLLEVVAAC